MKKNIILVVAILFLIKILSCRIVDINREKICPPPRGEQTISETEANAFLSDFREYVSRGFDKKVLEEFYEDAKKPEDRLPFFVRAWFEKKCIDPKRFYYVEQRLRAALKIISAENNFQRLQDHLNTQIVLISEKEKYHRSQFSELQKAALNTENISAEELAFVRAQENKIRYILEQ